MRTPRIQLVLTYATLFALVLFVGFPLLWMVTSSLKTGPELFTSPPRIIPTSLTLEWYREVLLRTSAPAFFWNSLLIATATTAISITVGTLGGYSMTRFRYPGRNLFMFTSLLSYVFPAILLFVPIFVLLNSLSLIDSKTGVVLSHIVVTMPLSLWMLRSFFLSIPRELDEAAWVDGASYFQAFILVILPLALPGIFSTAVIVFIMSWNEFLFASVIGTSTANKTLPVGISEFITSFDIRWGEIMALGTLATLPVVIFFTFIQRYFLQGVTSGAVKG